MVRRSPTRVLLTVVAGALLVSACARPEEAPTIAALELRPLDTAFVVGREQPLSARAELTDGTALLASQEAEWTSSNPEVVALRRDDQTTIAVARAAGVAELSASFQGVHATMTVKVGERVVDELVLESDGEQTSLPKGRTFVLRAHATWSDASVEEVTAAAAWETTAPAALAWTGRSGEVLAASEGAGVVRATFGGRTAELSLQVEPAVVDRLEVDPPVATLAHGTQLQLLATAILSDGAAKDVTSEVSWTLDGEQVASIEAGLLSGSVPGAGRVRAELGEHHASIELTVTPAELVSLSLSGAPASLPKGVSTTATLTGVFTDGSSQDLSGQATWLSSEPTVMSPATGGEPGRFVAAGLGTAELSATFGGQSASLKVEVTAAELKALNVSPSGGELSLGLTASLVAAGIYTDATVLDLSAQVAWSSSSPSVATVDAQGLVTPVALGTATIVASHQGQMAAALIEVTPAELVSLQLVVPSSPMPKGTSHQVTAQGTFSDGRVEEVTSSALWTSAHGTIAAVSNALATRGTVTALAEGNTMLTASLYGVSATVSLSVGPAVLQQLELDLGGGSLPVGLTQPASATAVYSDGTRVDVVRLSSWTSSDVGVAYVDGAGNVQTADEGVATIGVEFGGFTASAVLTVTAPVVTSVVVPTADLRVTAGQTMQLSALAGYSDGSTVDVSQTASWTSLNPAVATISNQAALSGVLTAHSVGVAWVEVWFQGSNSRFSVTVE